MASQKPVHIVGLGIAGAVLGRSLQARGVPTVIFEKARKSHRFNYSITLQPQTYRALLPVLGIDAQFFRQLCAVEKGGSSSRKPDLSSSLRVNRGDFESVLKEGLEVNWEHTLTNVEETSSDSLQLTFENGQKFESSLLVAADGVHSYVRQAMAPNSKPNVLSFAAINGKRRLDANQFSQIDPYFLGKDRIEYRNDEVLLQAYVNARGEQPSISYTYSRPAQGEEDALYKPNRPLAGATDIPHEFLSEVEGLGELPQPWNSIFDIKLLKDDRKLHWLMRSNMISKEEIASALESNVAFIGDALHTVPIIGSHGADIAVQDALAIAELIANGDDILPFYEKSFDSWNRAVAASESLLEDLHKTSEEDISSSRGSQL